MFPAELCARVISLNECLEGVLKVGGAGDGLHCSAPSLHRETSTSPAGLHSPVCYCGRAARSPFPPRSLLI